MGLVSDGKEKAVRAFVCVTPPGSVVRELERLLKGLGGASEGCGYRWVRSSQLHITLKFLGETSFSRIEGLRSALRRISAPPFVLSVDRGGAFPNASAPRVIWLGVGEGAEELKSLAGRVEFVSEEFGFPPEKRAFRAHLSIARSKDGRSMPAPLVSFLGRLPSLVWKCDTFTLTRSELTKEGAVYTPIEEYPLG